MRSVLAIVVALILVAASTAADPQLVVRNNSTVDIQFSFRSVDQKKADPPIKVAKGKSVDVTLSGDDPFFVQLDLGEAGVLCPGEPLTLKKWAADGKVFDVQAFSRGVVVNGKIKTIFHGWVGGAKQDDKDPALAPLAPELLALRASAWESKFTAADGKVVAATVTLKAATGTYKTDQFEGKLTDVWYAPNKDDFTVLGRWETTNTKGVFRWTVGKDRTVFVGEWRADDSKEWRKWTGNLTKAKAPPK